MSAYTILREVAADHVVALDDMIGPRRFDYLVDARSEAAYRLWRETDLRLREIAAALGIRDHSSAIYLIRRYERRSAPELAPRRRAPIRRRHPLARTPAPKLNDYGPGLVARA